jgi:DNA-binding NarL/FixJ family response regulator
MTSQNDYPWPYYLDLQRRSRNLSRIGNYARGIECALDFLLDAIASGTVPSDPDDLVLALDRVIASGARLDRSHAASLAKFAPLPETASSDDASAEARIELSRIMRLVNVNEKTLLFDVGLGYADREIAERRNSTPGAVRVRLSRLRLKLAA